MLTPSGAGDSLTKRLERATTEANETRRAFEELKSKLSPELRAKWDVEEKAAQGKVDADPHDVEALDVYRQKVRRGKCGGPAWGAHADMFSSKNRRGNPP
jgi:hypothetical protein